MPRIACARFLGRLRPMHMAARLDHLLLIALEIEIEMREHVVLDVARLIAQRVEFRQIGPAPWRASR